MNDSRDLPNCSLTDPITPSFFNPGISTKSVALFNKLPAVPPSMFPNTEPPAPPAAAVAAVAAPPVTAPRPTFAAADTTFLPNCLACSFWLIPSIWLPSLAANVRFLDLP